MADEPVGVGRVRDGDGVFFSPAKAGFGREEEEESDGKFSSVFSYGLGAVAVEEEVPAVGQTAAVGAAPATTTGAEPGFETMKSDSFLPGGQFLLQCLPILLWDELWSSGEGGRDYHPRQLDCRLVRLDRALRRSSRRRRAGKASTVGLVAGRHPLPVFGVPALALSSLVGCRALPNHPRVRVCLQVVEVGDEGPCLLGLKLPILLWRLVGRVIPPSGCHGGWKRRRALSCVHG